MSRQSQHHCEFEMDESEAWRYDLLAGYLVDSKNENEWVIACIMKISTPDGQKHGNDAVAEVSDTQYMKGGGYEDMPRCRRLLKLFSPEIQKPFTKSGGALHREAAKGDTAGCKRLIDDGVESDTKMPALYAAIYYGHTTTCKLLVKGQRIDVNKEECDVTPLLFCAMFGNASTCALLIECGADVNAKIIDDRVTPLHLAAQNGDADMGKLLIEARADINAPDGGADERYAGRTPLHYALFHHYKSTYEMLIRAGADVNAKDVHGNTPLHIAIENQGGDTVWACKLLIKYGADVTARNNAYYMPLNVALGHGGDVAVSKLLTKHGGKRHPPEDSWNGTERRRRGKRKSCVIC